MVAKRIDDEVGEGNVAPAAFFVLVVLNRGRTEPEERDRVVTR